MLTSSWHVLFTGLARHLCTWLMKVKDVGSTRPPTDRALFHTQHIWWQQLCCCRATCLEQPPSTLADLRDEHITYNSFRRELKTYWFYCCFRGAMLHPDYLHCINTLTKLYFFSMLVTYFSVRVGGYNYVTHMTVIYERYDWLKCLCIWYSVMCWELLFMWLCVLLCWEDFTN